MPIIVWGSHLVIRLADRFPSVILLGGAVLAWTGYTMIVREPLLVAWFDVHAAAKPLPLSWCSRSRSRPGTRSGFPRRLSFWSPCSPACWPGMLAVEVAGLISRCRSTTRAIPETGGLCLEAICWLGWLPPRRAYLWMREQTVAQVGLRVARSCDRAVALSAAQLSFRRRPTPTTEAMRTAKIVPSLVLGLILSTEAPAWADDMTYCADLSAPRRYLGNTAKVERSPDVGWRGDG